MDAVPVSNSIISRQTTVTRSHLSVKSIDGISTERRRTSGSPLAFADVSVVNARSDDSDCAGDSVSDLQSTPHGSGESAGRL
jgi:hypothetical protein